MVQKFFLGVVTPKNDVSLEIQSRFQASKRCFCGLRKQSQSRHLSRPTKSFIYKTLIRSVLLYGSTHRKSQEYHPRMWKTVVVRIHLPQKWNTLSFIKICQFLYPKVCDISIKPKTLHKTSAPTSQFWNFFILKSFSFHFHFVAIILYLWLMKFSMPEKWTYLTR
jgi:hypothetical protein